MEGWIQPWSHPLTTKFCSAAVLLKPWDIPGVIFSRWKFSHHPSASSRQFSVIPPHTQTQTMLCEALPHGASQTPFSVSGGPEGQVILAHSTPSHPAHSSKTRTSKPCIIVTGLPRQAHLLHSREAAVWGQPDPDRRGRRQSTISERPRVSLHLLCPTWHLPTGDQL